MDVIADKLKPDRSGRSALHYGVAPGDLAVVHTALTAGADPNEPDDNGWTPLHFVPRRKARKSLRPSW